MTKEIKILNLIKRQLAGATIALNRHFKNTGKPASYFLDADTDAGAFLLDCSESERAFVLHKLEPELEIEQVQKTCVVLKLK